MTYHLTRSSHSFQFFGNDFMEEEVPSSSVFKYTSLGKEIDYFYCDDAFLRKYNNYLIRNDILIKFNIGKISDVEDWNKFNKFRKIIICRNESGKVYIPYNTYKFSCHNCKRVTGFMGYANIMIFSNTNLSGQVIIPEQCNIKFSCWNCKKVTNVLGSADEMILGGTNISGVIHIPTSCSKKFSCWNCKKIIAIIGYADEIVIRDRSLIG